MKKKFSRNVHVKITVETKHRPRKSEKKNFDRTGAGRSWRRPCHRWLIGRLLSARIKGKAEVYGGDSSALSP